MPASPFIGQIMMGGFNFAPRGWAFCNGQVLPISGNDALFTLIGTTYGGDGQSTFALPNLQSRAPIHAGTGPGGFNTTIGQTGGAETVTLTTNQLPSHTHTVNANSIGGNASPSNDYPASVTGARPGYYAVSAGATMNPAMVASAGGSQPFDVRQPFLALNFCISLFGIFPSQN
jgi:microcystin-dependent protein